MPRFVRAGAAASFLVAAVVTSSALGASAGLEAPPTGDGAPATTAYTILARPYFSTDLESSAAPTTTTASGTAAGDDQATAAEPAPEDDGVLPTQAPNCVGRLATIDLTNGVVTPLAAPLSAEACVGDLAFAPDGTLYGIQITDTDDGPVPELVRFDPATGAATPVGVIGTFNAIVGFNSLPIGGIEFDAQGRLFVALVQSDEFTVSDPACLGSAVVATCLYRIDDPTSPSAVTFVGRSAEGDLSSLADIVQVSSLGASCTTMYSSRVVDEGDDEGSSRVTTVDTTTAALTELGTPRDDRIPAGIATDRSGTIWAIELLQAQGLAGSLELVTLNPAGGTPIDTLVAPVTLPGDEALELLNGLAIEPLACAEPPPPPLVLQPTFTG